VTTEQQLDYGPVWAIPDGSVQCRVFVAYWFFVGWWALNLGVSVSFKEPNLEIHVPFGFLRIGWIWDWPEKILIQDGKIRRAWGWKT
jgi:hypothetical protein